MDPNIKVDVFGRNAKEEDKILEANCRKLIGSLTYAALGSRPDLCAFLNILSRYQDKASEELRIALKRMLRYIK